MHAHGDHLLRMGVTQTLHVRALNTATLLARKVLGRTHERFGDMGFFMACWLAAIATHFGWLGQMMHADYSLFLRVARDWAGGLPLYEYNYDNKSPLVFLWVRMVDSPCPKLSLYLAETLLAAIAGFVLFRGLRSAHRAAAFAIPIILIAATGVSPTYYGGQTTEAPAVWFGVLAFGLLAASGNNPFLLSFAAGIAYFVMGGFFPPAALIGLAFIPLVLRIAREQGTHNAVSASFGFLVGIAASLAAFVVLGISYGWWNQFCEVLACNIRYAQINHIPIEQSLRNAYRSLHELIAQNQLFVVLACISTVLLQVRGLPEEKRILLFGPLLWLVGAALCVLPGGRHFLHYYHFLVVPLAFLAGLFVVQVCKPDEVPWWLQPFLVGLILGCFIVAFPSHVRLAAKEFLESPDHPATTIGLAADYLNHRTSADEPVMMCVWGDVAELYWRVPRPAVSRHAMPENLPIIRPEVFAEWMADLFKCPPRYVVIDNRFENPEPGAEEAGHKPWGGREANARLRAFFSKNYVIEKDFGPVKVLHLR
jgi:hypothetical protein